MHLSVDTAVTHLDLEGSLVSPGVVPGVDAEPVVLTTLGSPTDGLDGVASEGGSGLVGVDSGLVGQEVLVDGEGSGHSSVGGNLLLDAVDTSDVVGGGGVVLVRVPVTVDTIWAALWAGWGNLGDVVAGWEDITGDVVSALWHGVGVAEVLVAIVSTGDDTGALEPGPWGSDLTTIASEGEALDATAAAGGISDREEVGEGSASGNAHTVVEGLGGSVGPAGSAVGLVADVVDHALALWPLGTGIEGLWESVVVDRHGLLLEVDGPLWVNNGSHEGLDLLEGGTQELVVDSSNPVGVWVAVDVLDVDVEVQWHLSHEHLVDVWGLTEVEGSAGLEWLVKVDEALVTVVLVDSSLEGWVGLEDHVDLVVLTLVGVLDNVLAHLTDVVGLSEELVRLSGGNSGDSGQDEVSHDKFYYYTL